MLPARRRYPVAFLVALACVWASGCGESARTPAEEPEPLVIGYIYVGATDDRGYNEAAHQGQKAVARAFPEARILSAEHVPETPAAGSRMQRMIDEGARIIFATSYGHLEPALQIAARNPHVTFLHQGGQHTAPNLGAYYANIWTAQYAAGQAAGMTTTSDRLGYVAAFPIAQSLLAINAYQLGARSVNPRVRTRVVFTGTWCDEADQRRAARRVLAWGADVVGQHQDCTLPVLEEAARAGAMGTGFHVDARDDGPEAWLTGTRLDWSRLMVDMVRTVRAGRFTTSRYAGRLRVGLEEGVVRMSRFGAHVPQRVRATVTRTARRIAAGTLRPFDGPVRDQKGRLRIAGAQPSTTELEEVDYLVEGVVGKLPPR